MLLGLNESTSTVVGPAVVSRVIGNRVEISLPDQETWALMALAYPYQPQAGDIVLVIGQSEKWYVIGILSGSGTSSFTAPADLVFKAPHGRIDFLSGTNVSIKSPQVQIQAHTINILAHRIIEKFERATRWIKGAWQIRAGRIRSVIETTYQVKAQRIVERAKSDVKIDGRKINLG